MKLTRKIAFGCYFVVALVAGGIGIRYLLASQIMPYHVAAMDSAAWENLPAGVQIMSLNFMKAAGAGFLTAAIAVLFLLFIPYRKGEAWAKWALLAVSVNEMGLVLVRVMNVRANTSAEPPLAPFMVLIGIAVVGFLCSLEIGATRQPAKSNA